MTDRVRRRGEQLAVTADGSRFSVPGWDGSITVWPLDPLAAAESCGVRPLTDAERAKWLDPIVGTK